MNGIEKITGRIRSDAQAEADAILAAARKEAGETEASFRRQAEGERALLLAKAEKAAAEREERLVSAAQMEGRKSILAARQEMVEKAFDTALERLCSMPEEQYVQVLVGLVQKASSPGSEEVLFSPADRKRVGKAVVEGANATGKHLTLSGETRPIRGGFILRDGSVEVNCAFETLIRLEKGRSAAQAAKILFPEA